LAASFRRRNSTIDNPGKSLVDRAGFLKQTAIPVTVRNPLAVSAHVDIE